MLMVGSAPGVVVDIGVFVFCLLVGIGALHLAWQMSSRQQRRTLQRGDVPGASPVWAAVAMRMLYIVVGLVFLAIPVLTITGVIPGD
ncbi:MAG: hypothetical protein ACTHMY_09705 [Solirubrobacteraceae bacterium]